MTAQRVLFVCLGNICRSPAAEIIFRHTARKCGLEVLADSAGTSGYHLGSRPDSRGLAALKRAGYKYDGHVGRQFKAHFFDEFDLIIPQDEENRKDILRFAISDEQRARVVPMSTWFEEGSPLRGVPDPYYGDDADFDAMVSLLEAACARLVQDSRVQPR